MTARKAEYPRRRCFVLEDWHDGARLWQAVCLLRVPQPRFIASVNSS
jgi:hypothetical protein